MTLWLLDLFSHWILQYWILSAVLLVYFIWRKSRFKTSLTLLVFIFCSYQMLTVVFHRAPRMNVARPDSQVRILEFNVQGKAETLSNWLPLNAGSFDVAVLLETGLDFQPLVDSLKAEYPYQVLHLENSPFGMAILSRWEVLEKSSFFASEGTVFPQYELLIQAPTGDRFLLYALHFPPPLAPQLAEAHEVLLGELIERLQAKKYPALVVGGLNLTPYSQNYTRLMKLTGLRDSAGLSPWQHTWPSWTVNLFSPLGIRIDHCLVSTTFSLVSRERLEDLNSDHLPVKCVLQIEK